LGAGIREHLKDCQYCDENGMCVVFDTMWAQAKVLHMDVLEECLEWHVKHHQSVDQLFKKMERVLGAIGPTKRV